MSPPRRRQAAAPAKATTTEEQRLLSLLEISERERRMLGYEIHDGFVQELVSAQLVIDGMLDELAKSDAESVAALLRVRAFVRKSIDDARRIIGDLRLTTTEDASLVESIQFLVHQFETAHQLSVEFRTSGPMPTLPPSVSHALARVVQEALHNVHRHAHVHEASVTLKSDDKFLQLEISDRGRGFRPGSVKPGHFGLEGMRERARACNGELTVRSAPGKGTTIQVRIPQANIGQPPTATTTQPKSRRKN